MNLWKNIGLLICLILVSIITACTSQYTTKTKRAASEQLVLSTSVDKALDELNVLKLSGQKVYLDVQHFDVQDDKGYIISSFKRELIMDGVKLVNKAEDADVIFIISCGTYANDYDELLLGIPELPVPIPFTGSVIVTPEMAFFKKSSLRGVVRLEAFAHDAKTKQLIYASKPLSATSYYNKWVMFFLISFKTTDVGEYNRYSILKGDINR